MVKRKLAETSPVRLAVTACAIALVAIGGTVFSSNQLIAGLLLLAALALAYLFFTKQGAPAAAESNEIAELREREAGLRTVIGNALDAVIRMSPTGQITEWSGQAAAVFGWTRAEAIGRQLGETIIPERYRQAHAEGLSRLLNHGAPRLLDQRVEIEGLHRDGHEFPIELSISKIPWQGSYEFSAFVRDISRRRQREEELILSETVFNTVDEAVMISDIDNLIIRVNPAFSKITGYSPAEVIGRDPRLLSAGTHPPGFYRELWESVNRTGSWRGEVKNRHKNGSFYIEWLSIKRVDDSNGHLLHYLAVFSDISERKSEEAKVQRLAHHDPLTDLPNRTLLADRLSQALAQARREQGRLALLFIDLDKFKPVNDSHGHQVGDRLLEEVARRLINGARASDTVARLGGDEFVVLLPSINSAEDAIAVAEMIQQALDQTFVLGDLKFNINSSIGVALYPDHGLDEASLMHHADCAMYLSKQQGGSLITLYPDPAVE